MFDFEHWNLGTKIVVADVLIFGPVAAAVVVVALRDIRWHKKHPSTNDYLAKVDNELRKNGQ